MRKATTWREAINRRRRRTGIEKRPIDESKPRKFRRFSQDLRRSQAVFIRVHIMPGACRLLLFSMGSMCRVPAMVALRGVAAQPAMRTSFPVGFRLSLQARRSKGIFRKRCAARWEIRRCCDALMSGRIHEVLVGFTGGGVWTSVLAYFYMDPGQISFFFADDVAFHYRFLLKTGHLVTNIVYNYI